MQINIEEKKKILGFASRFSEIVEKNKWISNYDSDNDSLVIRTPNLSNDARKRYVTDEFALYLSPADNIQGVFIEYFSSNFLSHNARLKSMRKKLKVKKSENAVMEVEQKEIKKVLPILESVFVDSIFSSNQAQIA